MGHLLALLDASELQHGAWLGAVLAEQGIPFARQFEGQEAALVAVFVMLLAGEAPAQRFRDRAHGEAGLFAQFLQPSRGF
jgi:hypothetical protein